MYALLLGVLLQILCLQVSDIAYRRDLSVYYVCALALQPHYVYLFAK